MFLSPASALLTSKALWYNQNIVRSRNKTKKRAHQTWVIILWPHTTAPKHTAACSNGRASLGICIPHLLKFVHVTLCSFFFESALLAQTPHFFETHKVVGTRRRTKKWTELAHEIDPFDLRSFYICSGKHAANGTVPTMPWKTNWARRPNSTYNALSVAF